MRLISRTLGALALGVVAAVTSVAHAASAPGPGDDDRMLRVVQHVAATGVPTEHVRDLYDLLVYRNSDTERRVIAHLDAMAAKIDAAVDNGRISEADGAAKMAAARAEVEDKLDMRFMIDALGLSEHEAYLEVTRANLEDAVAAGKITREEADAKLEAVRRGIGKRLDHAAYLEAAARKLREAVAAGDLSPEEARRKMQALRAEIDAKLQAGADGLGGGEGPAAAWIGGVITEVTNSGITLRTADGQVHVLVNDHTRITRNGEPAVLHDLQPRDRARVNGERTDRGFVASAIHAHAPDGHGDGDVWIGGSIIEVFRDGISLHTRDGRLRVYTNDHTRITLNGEPAHLADLRPGDHARVRGARTDHGFVASHIAAARRDGDDHDYAWIRGTISEIHRDGLILVHGDRRVRVLVNDHTRITLNDHAVHLEDLEAGDHAAVQGMHTDRGFLARLIAARRR